MMNTAEFSQAAEETLPSTQLTALCHLINKRETASNKAHLCAHIVQNTISASQYTKPTIWVYGSLYDTTPLGLVFSPTKGLAFFLPIDAKGDIIFEEAFYLEKSFSALSRSLRSGNSVLSSDLGQMAPIPSASLAQWIERNLGQAKKTSH